MLGFYLVNIAYPRFVFFYLFFTILVLFSSCNGNNRNSSSKTGLSESETNIYIKNAFDDLEAKIIKNRGVHLT